MKGLSALLFAMTLYASNQGYLEGLQYYYDKESANNPRALELLGEAGVSGNADACFLIGVAYAQGTVAVKDSKKAFAWFLRAANLGDLDAMMFVGWSYYKAEGVEQNLSAAKAWFEKAAALGETEADEVIKLIEEKEHAYFF